MREWKFAKGVTFIARGDKLYAFSNSKLKVKVIEEILC